MRRRQRGAAYRVRRTERRAGPKAHKRAMAWMAANPEVAAHWKANSYSDAIPLDMSVTQ